MRTFSRFFSALLLGSMLIAVNANAHEYEAGKLTIFHPYAYEVSHGSNMTWAFMYISNDSDKPDTLLSASSPIASSIDIMEGEKKFEKLEIGANKAIKLKHKGIHLVLKDVKEQIAPGQRRPITLVFEKAGTVEAELLFSPMAEVSFCDDGSHGRKIAPKPGVDHNKAGGKAGDKKAGEKKSDQKKPDDKKPGGDE